MRFSLSVLFGILLCSGIFFLPQGEAQTSKREQLKEELRKELREELREEVEKELQEKEQAKQKFRVISQELQEHVISPCRNVFLKQCQLYPKRRECEEMVKTMFMKLEHATLKEMLREYKEDEDERMGMYFVIRRKCEKAFSDQ